MRPSECGWGACAWRWTGECPRRPDGAHGCPFGVSTRIPSDMRTQLLCRRVEGTQASTRRCRHQRAPATRVRSDTTAVWCDPADFWPRRHGRTSVPPIIGLFRGPHTVPRSRGWEPEHASCFVIRSSNDGHPGRRPLVAFGSDVRASPVVRQLCSSHRRHAAQPRAGRLVDVAPDPRWLGLQPAGPDHSRQRGRPAHGVDPGDEPGQSARHATRLPRRALHAEPGGRDPGA